MVKFNQLRWLPSHRLIAVILSLKITKCHLDIWGCEIISISFHIVAKQTAKYVQDTHTLWSFILFSWRNKSSINEHAERVAQSLFDYIQTQVQTPNFHLKRTISLYAIHWIFTEKVKGISDSVIRGKTYLLIVFLPGPISWSLKFGSFRFIDSEESLWWMKNSWTVATHQAPALTVFFVSRSGANVKCKEVNDCLPSRR